MMSSAVVAMESRVGRRWDGVLEGSGAMVRARTGSTDGIPAAARHRNRAPSRFQRCVCACNAYPKEAGFRRFCWVAPALGLCGLQDERQRWRFTTSLWKRGHACESGSMVEM